MASVYPTSEILGGEIETGSESGKVWEEIGLTQLILCNQWQNEIVFLVQYFGYSKLKCHYVALIQTLLLNLGITFE